jgi:hypothetical protein
MLAKTHAVLIWTLLFGIWSIFGCNTAAGEVGVPEKSDTPVLFSVAYLWPVDEDRDIRTINLNGYYPVKEFSAVELSFYAGLTATYATGDITQLEGELPEGSLRDVNYSSDGVGIGPGILADLGFWRAEDFSFRLDAGVNFVLYNQDFPAGGDRYNFLWRAGPVVEYRFGKGQHIGFGWLWMHVSNGQGSGAQNPAYDAQGLSMQFSLAF